jgi:hypothetical protein
LFPPSAERLKTPKKNWHKKGGDSHGGSAYMLLCCRRVIKETHIRRLTARDHPIFLAVVQKQFAGRSIFTPEMTNIVDNQPAQAAG